MYLLQFLAKLNSMKTSKIKRLIKFPHIKIESLVHLKGQYHGRYHDFWPKFTIFKL